MNSLRSAVVTFVLLFSSAPLVAQTKPLSETARAGVFDRADRSAQAVLATARCARRVAEARSNGVFGPVDSLGRTGLCFSSGDNVFGAFLSPDSTFTHTSRLAVVDLKKLERYQGPVDTIALLAQSRATRDGLTKGYPTFVRDNRQFMPLTFRSAGDSIEVWLIPFALLAGTLPQAVGGERGFIYSPDGKTLAREVDASNRFRAIVIPDSGQVEIASQEEDVPLVSELIAADRIHFQNHEVRITTGLYVSALTGPEPSAWVHVRRR